MLNIVLVEPEIPQNTGNIARTCAATGARLHLVEPLGFKIDNAKLKRAGLDYWDSLDITFYRDTDDFFTRTAGGIYYYFTTKGANIYSDKKYPENVYLVFGKETAGIKEEILTNNLDYCVRIPMRGNQRSLNLSNAVAIAVYETLRQQNFDGLKTEGKFVDLI